MLKKSAITFKAFSEPIRLRILGLLYNNPELCVCDLMAVLGSPQTTISRHMNRLKTGGMVEDRRDKMWVHYRLKKDMPPLARAALDAFHASIRESNEFQKDLKNLKAHLKKKAHCGA